MPDDKPVALVTGAAGGIGAAIARRLGREGYHVIVADLDADKAAEVAAGIGEPAALDITDVEAVKALAENTPRLDALVNNAAIYPVSPMAVVEPDLFRKVLDVNLVAPLMLTQAFLPQLTDAENASVVNIASIAALTPSVGMGAYSPSKAGLVALTQVCAVEFADRGIRFNAIAPGGVVTGGTAATATIPGAAEAEERYLSVVPARRRALPEDIAAAVPFLLSRDSRFINGQLIPVDGGVTLGTMTYLRAFQTGNPS